MGEMVRPPGLKVRAHRRVWRQTRPGKLLAVQDQIGRRQQGCPPKVIAKSLRPPGRSLDPTGNGWARGMIAIPMRNHRDTEFGLQACSQIARHQFLEKVLFEIYVLSRADQARLVRQRLDRY